jgi:diguanylate cyclase (GGDEF)-like protein
MADQSDAEAPSRLLLVEDDPRDAVVIGEMLRAQWPGGLVLGHVDRVSDACRELVDHGATCVLVDLTFPDAQGLEALAQVHTAAPDAPIVVLAEDVDEELAVRAIRLGAQDFLVKSEINPAMLRRSVSYAIERKRAEARLTHQALHDPLTGLPNRALFLDRLGVALDRSRRTAASVAVLFLDVDNFKLINDSLGHDAGDQLLVALGHRLRALLRPMDSVARFGGDEFMLLFEDLASEREVVLIAERISRASGLPLTIDDHEVSITVSIGIAIVADPSMAPETLIRDADAAMYRAKELGRSRFELGDEATHRRAMKRLQLENELRLAVERSELRVHYQPKVELHNGAGVVGFEALVRWQHPERGLIDPGEFLPLAEETGLVLPIGAYVLEHALAQLKLWRAANPAMTMSVNLSLRQLEDTGVVSMVARAMRASGIDPAALCLEITESAVTAPIGIAARTLQALKEVGVTLAIDDFGTGYSSLTGLKHLPVDTIKIHESFVAGLGSDPEEAPIVAAVVELAHALGLNAVAEGVETETQLAQLPELGCDGAQGFLFGRPVPEDEAHALVVPC